MAIKYWLDGTANWATAADWTGGTVPGVNDDVTVYQGNPNATGPKSIRSLTTIAPGIVDFQNAGSTTQISQNVTNGGQLRLDPFGGQGGTQVNVGGTFANTGTTLIGNGSLSGSTSLTTHYVTNSGTIELAGSGANQASLVAGFTAGFGTLYTLTGTVRLFGNALVSFTSGQIKTLAANSYLRLSGATAVIADVGSTTSNSALTGLTTIARNATLMLDSGNAVSVAGNLTNYGTLQLDYFFNNGGASLTVGSRLTNIGYTQIGNGNLTAATTVTTSALVNKGTIELDGNPTNKASLIVGSAAGFGTVGTLSGTIRLLGNTLVSFTGGQITTIANNSSLRLDGPSAFVADVGSTTSNSALTGLRTIRNNATLNLNSGASISTVAYLDNFGNILLDYYGGTGGSSLSVASTLTNSGYMQIGNGSLSASATVNTKFISNSGTIELDGTPSAKASLVVNYVAGFGTSGLVTGAVRLMGNTLVSFASGQIRGIAANSSLRLYGPSAFVSSGANTTSNSALTGLTTIGNNGQFLIGNGATVTIASYLNNNGFIGIDYYGGESGTTMTVTGRLTNQGTIQVGNGGQTVAESLTVGSLTNRGSINLYGASGGKASFIVNGAAGTGVAGHLGGSVYLQGNTLLQFASGQIDTIDTAGTLRLNGTNAFVADAAATTSNSALTGLTDVNGSLYLENGATVSVSGALTSNGGIYLDYYGGESGSALSVGGIFDNGGTLRIGNSGQSAPTVMTVGGLSNTGAIEIDGSNSAPSARLIVNAAAGTGATGELTGSIYLYNNALLQFASGQIQTIDVDGSLRLNGAGARVATAGSPSSNSALTGLSEIDGTLMLDNSVGITTSGDLANYGNMYIDQYGGESGSSLTVGGIFDNESFLHIGNGGQASDDTLTATSLVNNGTIELVGNATAVGKLAIAGAVTNNGAISINNEKQVFAGAVSGFGSMTLYNNGSLELDGNVAAAQTINFQGNNTLILGNAKTFAAGVANFNAGDFLDLTTYAASSTLSYAQNAAGTAGVLTVGTGVNAAHINFDGNFTTASFTAASDGSGGLLIGHV